VPPDLKGRWKTFGIEFRGKHPNRLGFRGVLTRVDEASDRAPTGTQGKRVLLTREAAERALPSLIGMAIDHAPKFDAHDAKRKIGVITDAVIQGGDVLVSGFVYARDFPEVVNELKTTDDLGMSYELADAKVEDVRAQVWKLMDVTFTGAAVLKREKAAYGKTSIAFA
jgi:hypothetical protein